jgi:hypothetical protein
MSWRGKVILAAGAVVMVTAFILRLMSILTTEEFSVLLAVGFMVFAHPLDFRKRALVTRDEFVGASTRTAWRGRGV